MNMERIEIVLFNCRKALKILHPKMGKEDTCFICKTYMEAGEVLAELEDLAVLTTVEADTQKECRCSKFYKGQSSYSFCPDCGHEINK